MLPADTNTTDELDRQDMARLCAGHDAALDDLMERHATPVFRFLGRLLQDEEEAADLAQTAFVRVYQHRDRFDPEQKFSTWAYAIATNLARDRLRWLSRHPQVSLDAPVGPEGSDALSVLPHEAPNPGEQLDASERAALVRSAVAALPEELRLPLVLAEYEEKSHADIAAILRCSPKAVEMRIYRARQQLRQALRALIAG